MAHVFQSRLFCWVFLLLCSTQIALSQDYVYAAGDPNFSVNFPVENGYINITNGNLHLEITLADLKQRGTLTLNEKLVYDSRIWKIVAYDHHYWWPINIPNSNGWRFVKGNETGTLDTSWMNSSQSVCDWNDPEDDWVDTTQYTYSWTDPQGTVHQFGATWTENDRNGDCYTPPNPESVSGLAIDGSGYSIVLTGDDADDPTLSIVDSQGTQVYPQVMDRNGNYFSSDANGNLIDDLGRTPIITTQNGNVTYYDVLTIGGARKRYTVTWEPLPVNTNFQEGGVAEWSGTFASVVQSIQLPDGNAYSFTYDSGTSPGNYGELTSMTLPTGGTNSYGWTNYFDSYQNVNRWLSTLSVAGGTTTFSPSLCSNGSGCQEQVSVLKPSGDETDYQLTLNNGAWNTNTTVYNWAASYHQPLVAIVNTYDFSNPCGAYCNGSQYINKSTEVTTLMDTGLIAQRAYGYANPQSGLVTSDTEWDYYTGTPSATPTRETDYSYSSGAVPGLLLSKTLCGNGQPVAFTTYNYTDTAIATSGIPQHNVTSGPYSTSISKWLNLSPGSTCAATTASTPVTTTYSLYDTGMVQSVTDADSNPATTYGYDSTGTFVTSVTRPTTNGFSHVSQANYDVSSGLVTHTIDENGQSTGYSYYSSSMDPNLGKPYQVTYPDGGVETYTYPSAREVDTTTVENATTTISSSKIVDPFGRQYQTVQDGISSETTYDGNSRVYSITNQHISSPSPTDGIAVYRYDGLDRVTLHAQPSGWNVTYSYLGNTVTQTDEVQNKKKFQYDAFHQLSSVWEPDSTGALNLETDYQHDALGDVTCVQQQGGISGIGCLAPPSSDPSSPWHVRRYLYDPLSRLLQAYAPEAGYICYGTTGNAPATWNNCTPSHDGNGNLLHKTDARGVTINYAYDYLNRLTAKTYINAPPGSLASCYAYDAAIKGIGKPAAEWTTSGSCSTTAGYTTLRTMLAYDPMGRLWNEQQCTLGNCTAGTSAPPCQNGNATGIAYCYDYSGHQSFLSNGLNSPSYLGGTSSIAFTNAYDGAGRLSSLSSNWTDASHPGTLFSADPATGYTPAGGMQTFSLGSGIAVTRSYNSSVDVTGETAVHP